MPRFRAFAVVLSLALVMPVSQVFAGALLDITIPSAALKDSFKIATSGVYYTMELQGNYASTNYCSWSYSGLLPTGLSLTGTRYEPGSCFASVSGTPAAVSQATTYYFTVTVSSVDQTASKDFSIMVQPAASTNVHPRGSLIVDNNHVVYFVGSYVRYPYPSMEVFKSWGHKTSEIKKATSDDLALPVGSPAYMNYKPVGHVDEVTNNGVIRGWVVDKNQPQFAPIPQIYFDGPTGKSKITSDTPTSVARGDIQQKFGNGFNAAYGFEANVPASLWDGKQHTAYVYGIDVDDTEGKSNVLLSGSPYKFKLQKITSPIISKFEANPIYFDPNDTITLSWNVIPSASQISITQQGTTGPILSNGQSSGQIDVYGVASTSYTLTATYNGQSTNQTIYIYANAVKPTITYFDAKDDQIAAGSSTTLEWSTSDATVVTLNNSPVDKKGTMQVSPTVTTTYTLVAGNASGQTTRTAKITVQSPAQIRDEQRGVDIITIFLGLGMYSDAHANTFPDSLQSMVPTYLKSIPTGPAGAQSPCDGSNNDYVYTPSANRTDFTFRYCFEVGDTSSTDPLSQPGVHTIDYLQELNKSTATSLDARRLADIRQIQTALELFYNDNGRYPVSMNSVPLRSDGTTAWSTYLSAWPTAPTPPGGSCTSAQNSYSYAQLSAGTNYSLTFCLGNTTGGYGPGPHTASSAGIN